MIAQKLTQPEYDFIHEQDKHFITFFDQEMEKRGYTCDNTIGPGHCWGRYMLIYRKANLKAPKVTARIYIKDHTIALRFFFHKITKHEKYILQTPEYIKNVFTGEQSNCAHCNGENCRFQKKYDIDGTAYVKCSGSTFEFRDLTMEKLPELLALFDEFYSNK